MGVTYSQIITHWQYFAAIKRIDVVGAYEHPFGIFLLGFGCSLAQASFYQALPNRTAGINFIDLCKMRAQEMCDI